MVEYICKNNMQQIMINKLTNKLIDEYLRW